MTSISTQTTTVHSLVQKKSGSRVEVSGTGNGEICQGFALTKMSWFTYGRGFVKSWVFVVSLFVLFGGFSFSAEAAFSLSGTVYQGQGSATIGAGTQIHIKVGTSATTSTTTRAGGAFTIPSLTATGTTPITLFVNGSTTLKATTFLMGVNGTTNLTGIPLYGNTFTSLSTTTTGVVDLRRLTFFDFENDSDVLYHAPLNSTTTIMGDFRIATGTTKAPAVLLVKGDYTNVGILNSNGGRMVFAGSYDSTGGYDLTTTVYDSSFSVAAQETQPNGVTFTPDGKQMIFPGNIGDDISIYNLSTAFDVSTAVYSSAFSVAAQDTNPTKVVFNHNGTKMFLLGYTGAEIDEYNLSIPYNVTTAVYSTVLAIATWDATPVGLAFNTDGTKMYVAGTTGDAIDEYVLTTPFSVATAAYSTTFSVASQNTDPYDVSFNNDGTRMYVVGTTADEVNVYTLTTPFAVATAVYQSVFPITQDTDPIGIDFNEDGTKMFIVGITNDAVYEYHLDTPFDLVPEYTTRFAVSAQDTLPYGVTFNTDGTRMYVVGDTNNSVYQYNLTTGFNLSTAVYNSSFSVATQETVPVGIAFKTDGTKMYVAGQTGNDVNEYSLSTPWSVSTASYVRVFSFATQATNTQEIAFNTDGTKFFVVDDGGNDVNEYNLSTAWDVSTAVYDSAFSVASEETTPTGFEFSPDGTDMFLTGHIGDDINHYELSVGYDVSTARFVDTFSIATYATTSRSIAFNTNGTKMFVGNTGRRDVIEYDLPEHFVWGDVTLSGTLAGTSALGDVTFTNDSTKTIAATASTSDFANYSASSTVVTPSKLSVAGDYTNNGVVTADSTDVLTFIVVGDEQVEGSLVGDSELGDVVVKIEPSFNTWTARSAAEANTWTSVTYGNGLFVAISSDGTNRVMTSPDGITWTARSAAEANSWQSVTYGNGLFVAVANSGTNRVMTSPDGITWTARSAAEANSWQSVTYGNGLFVAVTDIGTNLVMTSPNGITWTARTAAGNNDGWYSVTYGNGLFVAVSYIGDRVMTSPDGITWTARTAAGDNDAWNAITYGNGLFVAVGETGDYVMTSPDGITWTARTVAEANPWYSITYGNGLFVAVSTSGTNRVMTSPDGITWTARSAAEANTWYSVTYGNGLFVGVSITGTNRVMTSKSGNQTITFASNASTSDMTLGASTVVVAPETLTVSGNFTQNGTFDANGGEVIVRGEDDTTPTLSGTMTGTSGFNTLSLGESTFKNDGATWVSRSATEANSWYSVTYGNGLFVAVSHDGTNRVMTSPDGVTWTARTAAQANSWRSVTYGNGLFVAVSSDGTNRVMTSPDGIAWTVQTAAAANSWFSVTYGNGLFVAVSSDGTSRVMTSSNGTAWTSRTAAEANQWQSVTYGNSLFVATAITGTNRVMTSPDGITWTARLASETNSWYSVTYGNGLFVAVSETGTNRVMTSPDGMIWTARSATEANNWYSVTYGNGLFVAVAWSGTNRVMTSPDGITWTARSASEANGWLSVTYANDLFVAVANTGTNRVMTSASGAFTPAPTITFGNNASSSDFMVSASTTVIAPSKLTVAGNYENNGTFTAGSGTMYVSGTTTAESVEGFDFATAEFTDSLYTGSQNSATQGIAFSADGTKMYMNATSTIYTYTLAQPFNLSTASYASSFSVATYATSSTAGIIFNPDGTKMYVVNSGSDTIVQYTLSTPFTVSTAVYSQLKSVNAQDTAPESIAFNSDGTKLFLLGNTGDDISVYTLTIPYGVSSATFSSSFSVSARDTSPQGLLFSADGKKMNMSGAQNNRLYSYALATPWDLTTATYVSYTPFDFATHGTAVNADGTKLFIADATTDTVRSYSLTYDHTLDGVMTGSSAFNTLSLSGDSTKVFLANASTSILSIDTGTSVMAPGHLSIAGNYTNNGTYIAGSGTTTFSGLSSQKLQGNMVATSSFTNLAFSGSGVKTLRSVASSSHVTIASGASVVAPTKLSIAKNYTNSGAANFTASSTQLYFDSITESEGGYSLAGSASSSVFSLSTQDSQPRYVMFNTDGTKMFMVGSTTRSIHQYVLGTAFDVTTAVSSGSSFSLASQDIIPRGFAFNTNGTKLFVIGNYGDEVNEYNLSVPFDTSTAVYSKVFSVTAQNTEPVGIVFSPDGKRMLITGQTNSEVNEYYLSTGFDVSTAVYTGVLMVGGEIFGPSGIAFGRGGTSLFIADSVTSDIYRFTLAIAYDVTSAMLDTRLYTNDFAYSPLGITFNNAGTTMYVIGSDLSVNEVVLPAPFDFGLTETPLATTSVATQDTQLHDIAFNDDGTKLFTVGGIGESVYEYSLPIPWDTSFLIYNHSFSVLTQGVDPTGLTFGDGGTKMYVAHLAGTVSQYHLGTPYDISTAHFIKTLSVTAYETGARAVQFNADGTKMFVMGITGDDVNEFLLSTAWDIATAVYDSVFSVATQDASPQALVFSPDGTKMFMGGNTSDYINEYALATGFDVSTAAYIQRYYFGGIDADIVGLAFNADGTKLYVAGFAADIVAEYSLADYTEPTASAIGGTLTGTSAFNNVMFRGEGIKSFIANASTTNFSIATSSTVYAPTKLSIAGNYSNGGEFIAGTGTTTFSGASAQTATGTMTGASTFNHLQFTGAGTKTFGRNASTTNFMVESGATVVAPTSLTVYGDYRNSGTFTSGNKTVHFEGPTTDVSGTLTGTSAFGDVSVQREKWVAQSLPIGGDWSAITYGNGMFVVVARDGTGNIVTSLDGVNWTAGSMLATTTLLWNDIGYGNGLFVAVPSDSVNFVMTSSDGVTWSRRTTPEANAWDAVTYGNGLFVAVSDTGTNRVMTSPDGITWTARTAAEANAWSSVTYGNGLFVAVSTSGTNQVMTSPDGITWTARAEAEANLWLSIVYANGLFVAVSGDGTNQVMTSPDGITWTARAVPSLGWYSVTYGNGLFVAMRRIVNVGEQNPVMTSTDGVTWTPNGSFSELGHWYGIAYGNGLFVAVASVTGGGTADYVMTSRGGRDSVVTFANNATVNDLSIASATSTVYGPQLLSILGDYTNSGVFEAGTGTTTFSGSVAQSATGAMTGTSAFYNLELTNTATTTFSSAVTADHNLRVVSDVSVKFPAGATSTFAYVRIDGATSTPVVLRSTTDGAQWKLNAGFKRSVTKVNFKDSNACSGIDIIAVDSVHAGNSTCWVTATSGQVTAGISSASNQVFTSGQATTSIATITITDSQYPAITAANDIRIAIASGTVSMKFDTTDTTAVIGGSASGKVSTTVSYEQNGTVLVIPVTSDFAGYETITISGLSYAQFGVPHAAVVALELRTDGAGDLIANDSDSATVAIRGTLTVAEHTAGQVTNQFSSQNQSDASLFRFKLTPASESFTVSTLALNLSGVRRIDATNLTNIELYRDSNANGVYNVGDVAVGGTGVLSVSGQSGTITFSTPFVSTTTQNYIVIADVVDVKTNEYVTVSLNVSGLVTGVTSLEQVAPLGSVSSIQHGRGGGGSSGGSSGAIGGDAPLGNGQQGGGGAGGGETIGETPGFQIPTANGTVFNEWTSGASAYVSDGVYATAASTNLRQSYSVFGFNVPSGNTVQGIEVKLEASGSTGAGTIQVGLSWDGGSTITATKATSVLTGSDVVYTLGSPSDNWGRTWTPTELSNANFFVRVIGQPNSNTVRVDALQVKPYHQAGGGGGGGGGEI